MTDQTNTFQTDLNQGELIVPRGTWTISRTLTVPSSTVIDLGGTIKLADQANCSMFYLRGNDITFEGNGTLDGNSANQTKSVAGITSIRVNRVRLRGFTITNVHGWPVNFTSISNDIKLSEMELSNSLNAPQFADYCYDCWADKLHIFNIADYGWAFYGGVHRSGLTNSVIENCMPGAGILADRSQPMKCQDIVIAHNIFYTAPGTTKGNVEGIYVVNNTGDGANNHLHILVDSNVIYGSSTLSGGQKDGVGTFAVLMAGVEDSAFTNNIMHDVGSTFGLEVSGQRIRVNNNTIKNVGTAQQIRKAVGIDLYGAQGCSVSHNLIVDTQTTKTLLYGIGGSSGGDNVITYNKCPGASKAVEVATRPGDVVEGNQ